MRQYEPFFSQLALGHQFEFGAEVGVSPILCYDPSNGWSPLCIRTRPMKRSSSIPGNRTLGTSTIRCCKPIPPPIPMSANSSSESQPPIIRPPGMRSALPVGLAPNRPPPTKAAAHANTPALAYFDTLGRAFLTIADNAAAGKYPTRVELDIRATSVRCGTRLSRPATNKGVSSCVRLRHAPESYPSGQHGGGRAVDAERRCGQNHPHMGHRGHNFAHEYDALRRPTVMFVTGNRSGQLRSTNAGRRGALRDRSSTAKANPTTKH